MQTWKDAVNLSLRRRLLELLADDREPTTILVREYENKVKLDLKKYLELHNSLDGITAGVCVDYINTLFKTFLQSFRDLELDAQTDESEKHLFEVRVRTGESDVFVPERAKKSFIKPLVEECLNVIAEFSDLAPFLGRTEISEPEDLGFDGDLQLATPFYLLSFDEENFTGVDNDLKKEQARAFCFLKSNVGHCLQRSAAFHREPLMHLPLSMSTTKQQEEIEEKNTVNFYRFVLTMLSNLLWHFVYPEQTDGSSLTPEQIRQGFVRAKEFLTRLKTLFSKEEYKKYCFAEDIRHFIFQLETYFNGLLSAYEREKISNLSLRLVARNYESISRKLCEHVFELIYGEKSYAASLAADVYGLNELLQKDARILTVFNKRLPYKKFPIVNQQTETIIDVLILFSNATYSQKEELIRSLRKKSASEESKQFANALYNFRIEYIKPIKDRIKILENYSFFHCEREKIAKMVAFRLLPLCVLAMSEYGYFLQTRQASEVSDESLLVEQQVEHIVQSALNQHDYHVDLLHFAEVTENKPLQQDIKQLGLVQYNAHQLKEFLMFANSILDKHRGYLKYGEFRDACQILFDKTRQRAEELNEYLLRYSEASEKDGVLTSEQSTALTKLVNEIRTYFEEFNRYYQVLTSLSHCAYPSLEVQQHVQLIGQRLATNYKTCFNEEVSFPLIDTSHSTGETTSPLSLRRESNSTDSKVTSQMMQVSSLIGSCFSSLTWLSQNGYKGGYLKQLFDPLFTPPFCEEKAKKVVFELARICGSYRTGFLGFHANYAKSRGALALTEAILDASRQYRDLPLAEWLFGEAVALEIESSSAPRELIAQALTRLQQQYGWSKEDKHLTVPSITIESDYNEQTSSQTEQSLGSNLPEIESVADSDDSNQTIALS